MEMKKSIFVTVGTTRFDPLVEAVTTTEALQWMANHGYTHLVVQYGKGTKPTVILPNNEAGNSEIRIRLYSFQPSLEQDMRDADLILSHAGAGTIMEALRLQNKRLVVVINTALMDNHQTELAHAMSKRGHLFVVETPDDLQDVSIWNAFNAFVPLPFPPGDPMDFPILLDQHMGVVSNKQT